MERRTLLSLVVGLGGAALTGAMGTLAAVYARSTSRWRAGKTRWVTLCDEGEIGDVPTRFEIRFPRLEGWYWQDVKREVFASRTEDGSVRIFSSRCTHLGCSVRWVAKKDRYTCACHGGEFSVEGEAVAGPPEDPLEQVSFRIAEGKVEVEAT